MKIIVGKTAGFCYGVKKAVDGSIEQTKKNENNKIYCLGELVHNAQVIDDLKKRNLIFVEDISKIQDGQSKVIIRAHGTEKTIYEKAKENKIEVIDYTCPNVLKVHKLAEDYQKKGYYIFLIGIKKHPEIMGTASYCGKTYNIIQEKEDIDSAIEDLKKSKIKKLLIISQTTFSLKKFDSVINIVQEKIENDIEIIIKNTICLATEARQKETDELSKKVDAMIIIGGKNSSNTKKLYEIAIENCKNTRLIETKDEIDKNQYIGINSIGIMAGASTPQKSIEDVVEILAK